MAWSTWHKIIQICFQKLGWTGYLTIQSQVQHNTYKKNNMKVTIKNIFNSASIFSLGYYTNRKFKIALFQNHHFNRQLCDISERVLEEKK